MPSFRFSIIVVIFVFLSGCISDLEENLASTNTGRTVAEAAVVCGLAAAILSDDRDRAKNTAAAAAICGAAGVAVANQQGKLAQQEATLKSAIGRAKSKLSRLKKANLRLEQQIKTGRVTQSAVNDQLTALRAAKEERSRLASIRPPVRPIRSPGGDPAPVIAGLEGEIEKGGKLRECLRNGICVG